MASSRSARSVSGRGAHDDHLDHRRAQTRAAVDHADAAPGQARINAEHPHADLPAVDRHACRYEHLYARERYRLRPGPVLTPRRSPAPGGATATAIGATAGRPRRHRHGPLTAPAALGRHDRGDLP